MGLNNYTPQRHAFDLQGGSFSVRGLSLEDVSRLIATHLPDLEALYDLFISGKVSSTTDAQFENLIKTLVIEAPGFAANVIALASDEPDAAPQAAMLPFPVQIDVLTKIGDMTFTDVGGLGKGMESIAALLKKAKLTKLPKPMTKAG